MCPHVVRGALRAELLSGAIAALGRMQGRRKPSAPSRAGRGFIAQYYGGAEVNATLAEYLNEEDGSGYWLSLPHSESLPRRETADHHHAAGDATARWLDDVVDAVRPFALLGLVESQIDSINVRAVRASNRVPAHYDAWQNALLQVQGGSRRVLLFMPDNMPRLYLRRQDAPYGRVGWTSPVDLRDVDRAEFPQAHLTLALTAVLEPGDLLHIPAGWFHYIEATAETRTTPNVAVNLNTVHGMVAAQLPARGYRYEKGFVEHPCPLPAT